MEYTEDDFLQLSGIQHFVYCRRQWALIHIENQWAENGRTTDGKWFHARAHDAQSREKRGDLLIARGVYIHSRELGLSGQCDIVEFHRCDRISESTEVFLSDEACLEDEANSLSEEGVSLKGMQGLWMPYPIEYKRGTAKPTKCDEVQVCAQAMCLEEMYCCRIAKGALYYGENRRRQEVILDETLRQQVRDAAREMHSLYLRGRTPGAKRSKGCNACSLKEICLPELEKAPTASSYLKSLIEQEVSPQGKHPGGNSEVVKTSINPGL